MKKDLLVAGVVWVVVTAASLARELEVVGRTAEPPRGPGRPLGWRALLPGALR